MRTLRILRLCPRVLYAHDARSHAKEEEERIVFLFFVLLLPPLPGNHKTFHDIPDRVFYSHGPVKNVWKME
jgi:hypothetical protein